MEQLKLNLDPVATDRRPKEKVLPFLYISIEEWERQLENNNAYIIEETGEHFIMGWNPERAASFAQTVEIHPHMRMPYMEPKPAALRKSWTKLARNN